MGAGPGRTGTDALGEWLSPRTLADIVRARRWLNVGRVVALAFITAEAAAVFWHAPADLVAVGLALVVAICAAESVLATSVAKRRAREELSHRAGGDVGWLPVGPTTGEQCQRIVERTSPEQAVAVSGARAWPERIALRYPWAATAVTGIYVGLRVGVASCVSTSGGCVRVPGQQQPLGATLWGLAAGSGVLAALSFLRMLAPTQHDPPG